MPMANQLRFDFPCLVPPACSYVFPNNKERGKIKATWMKQSMSIQVVFCHQIFKKFSSECPK